MTTAGRKQKQLHRLAAIAAIAGAAVFGTPCAARAQTVATVRVAANGPVLARIAGKDVSVAARGLRALRVEAGKAVLYTAAATGGAQSILRWDVRTRKSAKLGKAPGAITMLKETKSERGRTIFLAAAKDNATGAPTTLILHPTLGAIFQQEGTRPAAVQYNMVRLDTYAPGAFKKGAARAPRPTGRTTLDFDRLVDQAFKVAPFVGHYASTLETKNLDGSTLRVRRILDVESNGKATLTSSVVGSPLAVSPAAPPSNLLTRRVGSLLLSPVARGGKVEHHGSLRPFPTGTSSSAAQAPRRAALFLEDIGNDANGAAASTSSTMSFTLGTDGTLTPSNWDLALYGEAPPPFRRGAPGDDPVGVPSEPEQSPAASPFIGTWRRTFASPKGPVEVTLEINADRTVRRTTRASDQTGPVVDTGTWAILPAGFSVRLTARNGQPLAAFERMTFDVVSGELVGITFDRTIHGTSLRFARADGAPP